MSIDQYLERTFHPENYNCWDLVREVWQDLTGHDIGDRTPHPATPLAMRRRFDREEREFIRLDAPRSPCITLLRRPRAVPHVGVYLRGRLLHMSERGCRYEPMPVASLGFTSVEFFTCQP